MRLRTYFYNQDCFIIGVSKNRNELGARMAKKNAVSKGQQKNLRTYQIVMGVIGVLIILSMVLSLVAK